MISASNLLITDGTFNQNLLTGSRGFELLAQNVATKALHDSGQVTDQAKCHPETRVAILTDIEKWADDLTYKYPVKWINGSAGIGKTAIMRTAAESLERKKLLLASFFFWRTGERCNTSEFLIPTLAYQISIAIPETRPYIDRAVEERPHIFTQKLDVQCRALIVDPITAVYREQALPSNHPRIFMIDGLDECLIYLKDFQDVEKQCEVLRTLHWTLQQLPIHCALLIASRPEYHIQTMFATSLENISSSLDINRENHATDDLRKFYVDKFTEIQAYHPLRSLLPSSGWPSDDVIRFLVRSASDHFIYASTVMKFIGATKKDPHTQLQVILDANAHTNLRPFQPLDVLYSTVLSTVDEEDLPATLRLLGALIITFTDHPPNQPRGGPPIIPWDDFLGLPPGETRRLIIGLESLVIAEGVSFQDFSFHHTSIVEFFLDSRRSGPFFIDSTMVYDDLTRQGLFHLCMNPTNHRLLTVYITLRIESWIQKASPSRQLQDFIEQAGTSIRPRDLRVRYPTFLQAIRSSMLPEKERLYDMKLNIYISHLEKIVELYSQDERLVFHMLCYAGDKAIGGTYYYFDEKLVDEMCPLSPELKLIDSEQGFYLYGDRTDTKMYFKGKKPIPDPRFNFFKESLVETFTTRKDSRQWYAKATEILVKYLSVRTRYPFGEDYHWSIEGISHFFDILLDVWLPRACIESNPGLIECFKNNPISRSTDTMVVLWLGFSKDYHVEVRRWFDIPGEFSDAEETEETNLGPNHQGEEIQTKCALEQGPLSGEYSPATSLLTGIWSAWTNASKVGQVTETIPEILEIDE